ncbi:recombination regulator RecX [Lactobacillus sp. S2-2]|uniref:recombination regulator RecX n=1 Tax=Lactobacillus sp. S2-2 TaxID=2692917 RepID=UPI001F0029F6|nr:recombination regulator RecX [Lactobacillus sp. S2-2]MCF6514823.1 recombination regulator RecX [Lactobacillus sp. S2-2]
MDKKMIVTKITTQKRKGRFNVYVNNSYAFPVSEDVMLKFHIYKDMELDEKMISDIKDADDFSKLYNYAVNFLSYQLRTEKEISDKLKVETDNQEKIDMVIDRLKELNLLSDKNYAESYVRSIKNEGNKGPKSIYQNLNKKGIENQVIEDAINNFYTEDDIHANASQQAYKIYQKNQRYPYNKKIEKIKTTLMQKGYEFDIINQVIEESDFERNQSNEQDLIEKEGTKIFNKYRKFGYNERVMKSKQALIRKGFSFDDINLFINEIKNKEFD